MGDDEWTKVIDITLTGTFRMTRAALKLMQPRGKVRSSATPRCWAGAPRPRAGSLRGRQGGRDSPHRCSALEAAEFGIRHQRRGAFHRHSPSSKSASEELLAKLSRKEAFGRGAEPWGVANVMIFLASDYSLVHDG